ncbi:hypothetical protein LSH36_141g07027 [Paralvinella palmiformis]|uniref:Uncharacterized protein n=1 Tax=Paralvinella palmiformis TaxID=53620 RepID=A0AAD9JWL0_9ANNE|nr:hypothetical protein LSH36_141g07027 [Paralvinella palmiformis]
MEFIERFNQDLWRNSDPDKHKGFTLYTVVRPQMITQKLYKYAVRQVRDDDDHCEFNMLTLDGASGKSDPLQSIRNVELLIRDGAIVGGLTSTESVW